VLWRELDILYDIIVGYLVPHSCKLLSSLSLLLLPDHNAPIITTRRQNCTKLRVRPSHLEYGTIMCRPEINLIPPVYILLPDLNMLVGRTQCHQLTEVVKRNTRDQSVRHDFLFILFT
jgi:hypothetical protein